MEVESLIKMCLDNDRNLRFGHRYMLSSAVESEMVGKILSLSEWQNVGNMKLKRRWAEMEVIQLVFTAPQPNEFVQISIILFTRFLRSTQ